MVPHAASADAAAFPLGIVEEFAMARFGWLLRWPGAVPPITPITTDYTRLHQQMDADYPLTVTSRMNGQALQRCGNNADVTDGMPCCNFFVRFGSRAAPER